MIRGFLLTGSYIAVVNSYISDIYSDVDAQAIMGATGPGPYQIHNNYLSASTEIVLFGGTGAPVGYSCTVASSPAPTTTSATVSSCIDAAGGSVSPPAVGAWVMFTTGTSPAYRPDDWVQVATSAAGALTFSPTTAAPLAGAAHVQWGMVPADIEITHNYFYKPRSWVPSDPTWDKVSRSSKNFVEAKYGVRWLIEGNVMANTWQGGQHTAINFNSSDQYGGCPWCVSSDITFKNNVLKNITGMMTLIGSQSYAAPAPGPLKRVLIQNNLFWPRTLSELYSNIALAGYIINGVTNGGGIESLQIIHNTYLGTINNIQLSGDPPFNHPNLVIRDNLTEFDQYRWTVPCIIYPDGTACIGSTISSTYSIDHNAIINTGQVNGNQGVSNATLTSRYGSMILTCCTNSYAETGFVNINAIDTDYHNYALTSGSRYHGLASDGTDPGVNFTLLDRAFGHNVGTVVTGKASVAGSSSVN